mmetsp:Transcript_17796/g.43934  ORF Transcript_17796/g.43934 Transcript_17796/m.43934 type:complete len:249 (-) Transcript_17796:589-1335(-)
MSFPCKSKTFKLVILVKRSDGRLPLISLREKSISFMAVQLANNALVSCPCMRLSSMYKYCILVRGPKSPMLPVRPLSSNARTCKSVCWSKLVGMDPVSKLLDNASRLRGNLVPNHSGSVPVMPQYCNSNVHNLVNSLRAMGISPSRPGLYPRFICSRLLDKNCNSDGMLPSSKVPWSKLEGILSDLITDGVSDDDTGSVSDDPSGVSQITPFLKVGPSSKSGTLENHSQVSSLDKNPICCCHLGPLVA